MVKTAPKGFDTNLKTIDLIRHKSFFVTHYFTDDEVFDNSFSEQVLSYFKQLHPFFNYMSDVFTTDLNGVSVIN